MFDTVNDAGMPACVTLMVCALSPPLTVIVAVRSDRSGFAEAETVTVPSSEPEDGERVSQDASLSAVQWVLEEMVNDFPSAVCAKVSDAVDTDSVGGAPVCVTLTV